MVVYVEHWEEEDFVSGKLEWNVGTGWQSGGSGTVWDLIDPSVQLGEQNEIAEPWNVTSFVTVGNINDLQLRVKNNDNVSEKKTIVDHVFVVVEWIP